MADRHDAPADDQSHELTRDERRLTELLIERFGPRARRRPRSREADGSSDAAPEEET